jgi:hypothetical protein
VSVADVDAAEASGVLTFTLALTDAAEGPASVRATTGGPGSATAGTDYTAVDTVVHFAAGATSATVKVPVIDDALVEGDETLTLTLSEPSGFALGRSTAIGKIVNDDCSDDGYEDNDTSGTAYGLGVPNPSVLINARLCASDPDHFTFTAASSAFQSGITYVVEFTAQSPILLDVAHSSGNASRSGTSGAVSITVTAGSTVQLRVLPASLPPSQGSGYSVRIRQN